MVHNAIFPQRQFQISSENRIFRYHTLQTLTFDSLYLHRRKPSQRTEVPIKSQTFLSENLVAKSSFNYGHSNRRDSGYFFFPNTKYLSADFHKTLLLFILLSTDASDSWGWVGKELLETLLALSWPLLAWVLSWQSLVALWVVDEVHCSDKGSLLEAFSVGETIHKATYTLFSPPDSNSLKKLKGL